MRISNWQKVKINLSKFWKSKWKNRTILSTLAAIFALAIIIPIVIAVTRSKIYNYPGETEINLIDRFDGSIVKCTENAAGNGEYWCRRGPVVISAPAKSDSAKLLKFNLEAFKDTSKKTALEKAINVNELKQNNVVGQDYLNNWGLLVDVVNWFYENVAWGPEILTFNKIQLYPGVVRTFFNDIKTSSASYSLQLYPKYLSGVKILVPNFIAGTNKEMIKYLDTKDDKFNSILNRFDEFKFSLAQAYYTYKNAWYTQDSSTTYNLGGANERKERREILNKYTELTYINERFKNVNTTPLNKIKSYNLDKAYDSLEAKFKTEIKNATLNLTNKGTPGKLTYLDLYTLANNKDVLNATKSFELSNELNGKKYNYIYDGIDYFSNVTSELTIFQLENQNIFNEIKELKINGKQVKDFTLDYLNTNNISELITSKIRFRNYKVEWLQNYFKYLIYPLLIINPGEKIENIRLSNYSEIKTKYDKITAKPDKAVKSLSYLPFDDRNFNNVDKFKIGLSEKPGYISTTNYYNQLKFLTNRDLMTLTINSNLFKKPNQENEYFSESERVTNSYFKDLALLDNFGANPYKNDVQNNISNNIKIDPGVINGLQKLFRMNSDISMSHLSEDSEMSILWGYVDADKEVDSLKFTNTANGENKYIKIWTQDDLDNKFNQNQNNQKSLLANEYIYKSQQDLLSNNVTDKILLNEIPTATLPKKKKLWVSNFAVIADYANAIAKGNYTVSFTNKNKSNHHNVQFDQQQISYGLVDNNENHILNSNGDLLAFAGWWFYTNKNEQNKIYFRVIGRSWQK